MLYLQISGNTVSVQLCIACLQTECVFVTEQGQCWRRS